MSANRGDRWSSGDDDINHQGLLSFSHLPYIGTWSWQRLGKISRALLFLHLDLAHCGNQSQVYQLWPKVFTLRLIFFYQISSPLCLNERNFSLKGCRWRHYSAMPCLFSNLTSVQGTLGIRRKEISTYYKAPGRLNLFQQVRNVETVSMRCVISVMLEVK